MKIRIFKPDYLDQLKRMPEKAKDIWYLKESPWLDDFFEHKKWYTQTKLEIPGSIELTTEGSPPSSSDLENSIKIYNALQGKLSPVQASDERLWTFFCHETFWNYMKWRWTPNQKGTIESRYFVNGSGSRALSRNGIARLWWFAHLTYDAKRKNPYELTRVFLRHQDIQHNLLERNLGRNKLILHAALEFLKSHPDINGKEDYVKLGKILNRLGGVRLLDCLNTKQIADHLEEKFPSQPN